MRLIVLLPLFATLGWSQPDLAKPRSAEFYVATAGGSANPGTREKPFASLAQAFRAIRDRRAAGALNCPVTIWIAGGVYTFDRSVDLSAADSGTAVMPLRIQALPGARVLFHGGRRLGAERLAPVTDPRVIARLAPEARGKVWQLDLRAAGITDFGALRQHGFATPIAPAPMELFIDGQALHLARYPNRAMLPIGKVLDPGSKPRNGDNSGRGALFTYDDPRIDRWAGASDLWLNGRFSVGYADDALPVAAIDPAAHTIRLSLPHLYGVQSSHPSGPSQALERAGLSIRGYYGSNLLEELDEPGEHVIERQSGMLYYFSAQQPHPRTIDVSLLEQPFLSLRGVHHLTIAGIEFAYARGMGIYQESTHDVTIEGCVFRNLGTVAVSMGQQLQPSARGTYQDGSPNWEIVSNSQFQNNVISNSIIGDNGTGGVIVSGGDRRTLASGHSLVENCEFYGNSRRNESFSPSVTLRGVGHTVRHCYFHDQAHQIISYQGNNFLIENNVFARVCRRTDDMGVIYTGRDPSARGARIRNNFFTDILPEHDDSKLCAIYVDDGSGGIEIVRNIFCRAGSAKMGAVFFHGGHDNLVRENFFVESPRAVGHVPWADKRWNDYLQGPLMRERLTVDVDIASPEYLQAYPLLADFLLNLRPRLNMVQDNLLYGTPLPAQGQLSIRDSTIVPLAAASHPPASWSLADIRSRFLQLPLAARILAEAIGLSRDEFDRWHAGGPIGRD